MLLIWNNKESNIVKDDSDWDREEFVIARKIRVQYKEDQPISIDVIKNSFKRYGAIEKIELFHDDYNGTNSAHITFKQSHSAHLAMDHQQKRNSNVKLIIPVHPDHQPDSPDSLNSSLYNLPNEMLATIFAFCDVPTLASLSLTCTKFSELTPAAFPERFRSDATWEECMTLEAVSENELKDAMMAAGRLVKLINPKLFSILITRFVHSSEVVTTSVTLELTPLNETSTLSIFVDLFKAELLCQFDLIAKRIECVSVRSIDKPFSMDGDYMFPNAKTLKIEGESYSIKATMASFDYGRLLPAFPSLEHIIFQHLHFNSDIEDLADLIQVSSVKKISFESCTLEFRITYKGIYELAKRLRSKRINFPLLITYTDVHYEKADAPTDWNSRNHYFTDTDMIDEETNDEIVKALNNKEIAKYLHVAFGARPADRFKRRKFYL